MKKLNLIFCIVCIALLSFQCTETKKEHQPQLIDRELFFGDPEISGAQLSPDGKLMSFIKVYKNTRDIWVKKTEEPFEAAKVVTEDTLRPIRGYFWSKNSKFILYVQDKGGDENFNIYAVNPADGPKTGKNVPEARNLTNLKGVRAFIYSISTSEPEIIYVGLNDRDKAWHDLYKLNIATGEKTLLRKNSPADRITGWIFDWNDKLRLATRSNADGTTDLLRVDEKKLEKMYSVGPFETVNPYAFDKDNKCFYMATNKGNNLNLTQLVLFDPVTLKEELIEKDPLNKVDFEGAEFSEKTRCMILTSYYDTKLRIIWKDKQYEEDYNFIQKELPGLTIDMISNNTEEDLFLINTRSDTVLGKVYLFDRKAKKLTFQYNPRPKVSSSDLATMTAVSYKSSDSLEIAAYLTLPKGADPKNLPAIVLPHGGPWGRDYWGYNAIAQFLANRGYAVLMPNFRGSTGYGKSFLNAGNKEWGQKMQDDITWGVKFLIEQGIADPKRVGIMGGSYGGYATLAGVAFTPDLYAAAVDIVGPSNLITLLGTIPPYWEAARKTFLLRMGDPSTPEGKELLMKQSPLNSANKIKTPLLVAQGANDPRVKQAEADQIVIALRDRGFPVEYILAPDEGHGFARPVNNMALMAAAEKFLAKFLNGRFQESMKPEVENRLKDITVDIKTVK